MRLVFLDHKTMAPYVKLRRPNFAHDWINYDYTEPEQIQERLQNADIAIVNKVELDAQLIETLPHLKLIVLAATGSDNVDLDACRKRGVAVANIQNYTQSSVPEHALSLMLALSRNLNAYRSSITEGRWQQSGQF